MSDSTIPNNGTPPPADPPAVTPTMTAPTTGFNEGFTAMLAGIITVVVMGILVSIAVVAFQNVSLAALAGFERLKDVLSISLSLFGTVLGYYFGRVPADKRADTADKRADEAQSQAASSNKAAEKQKEEFKAELDRIMNNPPLGPADSGALRLTDQPQLGAADIRQQLQDLRNRL